MLCVSSIGSWFWVSEHGIRHRCPFLDPYPSMYCPRPWVHKSSHSKEGNVFGYQNILICLQGGDRFTRKLIKPLSFTRTDPFQVPLDIHNCVLFLRKAPKLCNESSCTKLGCAPAGGRCGSTPGGRITGGFFLLKEELKRTEQEEGARETRTGRVLMTTQSRLPS